MSYIINVTNKSCGTAECVSVYSETQVQMLYYKLTHV